MKSITLKIKNGVPESIGVVGNYVRVKTASVAVRIQVESGDVDATIEQGDALNLKPFERLIVSHADAAEQSVTLLIGNGTSADSAKVGGSVEVSALPVNNATYAGGMAVLNVGSTQIFAADANRKSLIITNSGGITIYVNPTGADADGFSIPVASGGTLILDGGSAPKTAIKAYAAAMTIIGAFSGA